MAVFSDRWQSGRKTEIKGKVGAIEVSVKMVEDITTQKSVLLRDEDDFKTKACLSDLEGDEISPHACPNTVVGLC